MKLHSIHDFSLSNGVRDRRLGHLKQRSDVLLPHYSRNIQTLNLHHLRIGEFVRHSTLSLSVPTVVFQGAQKQMRRINAGRIIAAMKNALPIWNCSVMKHPRKTMGKLVVLSRRVKAAISFIVDLSSPQPAAARDFIYAFPKPVRLFFNREMLRVYAYFITAPHCDDCRLWNWANVNPVRKQVGCETSATDVKKGVCASAFSDDGPHPFPASIGFENLAPKSFEMGKNLAMGVVGGILFHCSNVAAWICLIAVRAASTLYFKE